MTMPHCKWFAQAVCTPNCDAKFCDAGLPAPEGIEIEPFEVSEPSLITSEHAAGQMDIATQGSDAGGADFINHPPHYTYHPSGVECIEITRLCGFSMGNAIKYVWRYADKNGEQDLEKARWYLNDVTSSGCASHPPAKAQVLLRKVLEHEDNPLRQRVLGDIVNGRLQEAASFISGYLAAVA